MTLAATKTTCPYCGVGCGVIVERDDDGMFSVRGDTSHPANFGRLCSKGSALAETLGFEDRLLTPIVDGATATWSVALDRIASTFSRIVREHGPDSVAFYVSGQLLTEDYYVVNKLAKGFIGTANIDTNSRLCMASSVSGHKRAFGSDTVPGNYEDLERADLLVFVGSNAAWCHPVLYQRMMAARQANPDLRIVVIDPRRTDTCDGADLHLPLRSGSDAVLFNGLFAWLAEHGSIDANFVASHTAGFDEVRARCAGQSIETTAAICGLPADDVETFFRWFAATERVVTLYSQGINQSASGTDKVNAIINCHLATGRIGREGMGPFSLTGQPNAMGGREVGGLANQLAAHMEIADENHRAIVQKFWRSPVVADTAGLKAVDMFDAVADGRIKAIWIMSTNPVVSMPDADRVRAALAACELVVVSDVIRDTDTGRLAHVLLPATAWGEKDGTVTNSERRISRQRAFMAPPPAARPDWWAICEVATRMGFAGFTHSSAAAVFREHAALSGFENAGTRDFDISGLAGISDEDFAAFPPVQWPVSAQAPQGTPRLFGEGGFFTPDRRARFVAVVPRPPQNATSRDYPLILNTGRIRDQWHTMTRTAKAIRLNTHRFEPYAEMHPFDAMCAGIEDGALVELQTAWGRMVARARVAEEQRQGCVFVPMHWTSVLSSSGRVNALVNATTDPISGQPESKHTPLAMRPYEPGWQAFALTRTRIEPEAAPFWVHGHAGACWRTEMAGAAADIPGADVEAWARALIGATGDHDWVAYRDTGARVFRFAMVRDGRLEGCLFLAPDHRLPPREWLAGLFEKDALSDSERKALLLGEPLDPGQDIGAIVCSCYGIGRKQIAAAIGEGAASVAAIGERLKAGTNCGSCKPELGKMLRQL
jgi:assimilatory nitrate reductase catalytic subunit